MNMNTAIDKQIFHDAVDSVMNHTLSFQEAIKIYKENDFNQVTYPSVIDGKQYGVTIFNAMIVKMAHEIVENLDNFTSVIRGLKHE